MKSKSCPVCGTPMKKNGFTSSGKQRWRCRGCGMSRAHSKDNTSIRLKEFLSWLFSKDTQSSMPGSGRTFRRRTKEFWDIWPMPEVVDEIHRVVYVDGIYLKRNVYSQVYVDKIRIIISTVSAFTCRTLFSLLGFAKHKGVFHPFARSIELN